MKKSFLFLLVALMISFQFSVVTYASNVVEKYKNEKDKVNNLQFSNVSEIDFKNYETFAYSHAAVNDIYNYEVSIFDSSVDSKEQLTVLNTSLKLINVVQKKGVQRKQRVYMIVNKKSHGLQEHGLQMIDKTYRYYGTNTPSVYSNKSISFGKYISENGKAMLYMVREFTNDEIISGIKEFHSTFAEFENMFSNDDFRRKTVKDLTLVWSDSNMTSLVVEDISTSSKNDFNYIVRKQSKNGKTQYIVYAYSYVKPLALVSAKTSSQYAVKGKSLYDNVKVFLTKVYEFLYSGKTLKNELSKYESLTKNNSVEVPEELNAKISTLHFLEFNDDNVKIFGADLFVGSHSEMIEILFSSSSADNINKEEGKELTADDLKKKIEINNNVNINNSDTNTNNNHNSNVNNNDDNTYIQNNNTKNNNVSNDSINRINQDTTVKKTFEQAKSVLSTVKNIPDFFSSVIDMFPASIKTLIYLSFTLLFIVFIIKLVL